MSQPDKLDLVQRASDPVSLKAVESVPEKRPIEVAAPASRRKSRPLGIGWLAPVAVMSLCVLGVLLGYLWSGIAKPEPTAAVVLAKVTEIAQLIALPTGTWALTASRTATSTPTLTTTFTPDPTRTPTPSRTPRSTATPTPVEEIWQACPDTYLSRLHVGDRAYISFDPPLANNVREQAGMGAPVIGKLQPGEEFTVVDGPECENNWVWWYVRSQRTGLQGWTAEGDSEDYWVVPISDG